MKRIIAAATAVALAAGTASAEPGGGKGGGPGNGGGNEHAGHAMGKPGGGPGERQQGVGERGKGAGHPAQQGGQHEAHGPKRVAPGVVRHRGNGADRVARGKDDAVRAGGRDEAVRVRDQRGEVREGRGDNERWRWASAVPERARGLIAGCPPGLAKKANGCTPPGLARAAAPLAFVNDPDWWNLDDRWFNGISWEDGSYRYRDGYLVRYDEDGIDGWLPLLGGALAPGNAWPSSYPAVPLPAYYQDYYSLGSPNQYRYYDDALYRVDPGSGAIESIAALLTGNDFVVGQRMPAGYDVYNVPYGYRDRYVDGPDAYYRYSDGYVYEVDPTTQLIQAAIELLT